MKKFALFALMCITVLTSCSLDDGDNIVVSTEFMPIESVEMPEFFEYGESYDILITYNRPSSCYQFSDFFYEVDGYQRTIAVWNTVYTDPSCVEELEPVTVSFNFPVNGTETYVFKFYQGEGDNGEDQYYIVEVPVMDERAISEGTTRD